MICEVLCLYLVSSLMLGQCRHPSVLVSDENKVPGVGHASAMSHPTGGIASFHPATSRRPRSSEVGDQLVRPAHQIVVGVVARCGSDS